MNAALGNPDIGRLARSFLPGTAVLEMTYACNHRCRFCSCPWEATAGGFERRPERDIAWWKTTLARLAESGVHQLAFTGGEPLLKDGLGDLIEFAATLRSPRFVTVDGRLEEQVAPLTLTLLSNGDLLDDAMLDRCARLGVAVGISLPGLSTFGWHTNGGDANVVLAAFGKTKARNIPTHVGITVTRRNLPELYETMATALLAGADNVLLNRFMPGGRGLAWADELAMGSEETREMLRVAETVLRAANRTGHVGTELPLCLVADMHFEHLSVGHQCAAATEFFAIDPSGHLRVCNHSPIRLASFDEVESVREDSRWRQFALKDYRPSACAGCSEVARCDAGCREAARIVHGRPDALDPVLPTVTPLGRRLNGVDLLRRVL
jgi:radical SAM protein with 4Fe4S-binding SPASM domain